MSPRHGARLLVHASWALLLVGCGGSVVKDDDGGGGAGGSTGPSSATGSGSPTTTSSGTTGGSGTVAASAASGGPGCDDHEDCPGGLCDFALGGSTGGTCIAACGEDGTCGPGLLCDECATASCGPCGDCVAGCVVAPPHSCDDHDDCGGAEACVYALGGCYPQCGDGAECAPGSVCDTCATSSCPGCRDCQAACVPAIPPGCTDHEECGDGLLCVFDGGYCSSACDDDDDCGSKAYCDPCLTSSCPDCDDCLAACVYLP